MNFVEAMKWRYTTKIYDPTKKIDPMVIEELKEVLHLSPSSINSQPWRFTFITDSVVKSKLAQHSYFNDSKIRDCPLLIVFSRTDNIEKFERWISDNLPKGNIEYYNNFIKNQPPEQIKSWFAEQLYISVGVILSYCATNGLDSSPMEGFDNNAYDKILELSDFHSLVVVAVGYRDEKDYNQPEKVEKSRRHINNVIYSM